MARVTAGYRGGLRSAILRLLPAARLPLLPGGDGRLRWTDLLLALTAILMSWAAAPTLADRFDAARRCLVRWHPGRRRPGATHQGFAAALRRRGGRLLKLVARHYRGHARRLAEARGCWAVAGRAAFGVDSTEHDAPMTAANERRLGTASRDKSWPRLVLTTAFHLGSGLPWAFLRGRAKSSERRHLLGLLGTLPADALVVADAGFTGYDFWRAVLGSGRSFLVRVGANVRVIEGGGGVGVRLARKADGIVWVWPARAQKRRAAPLVLRLVALTDGRNRTMHLLTDVLDPAGLNDAAAARLYGLRWGVEVLYRSLKQTLGRRKLLSGAPRNARLELAWSFVGLWTLALAKFERCPGLPPGQGVAAALRVLRRAAAGARADVGRALAGLAADGYRRPGPKKARHWPHKKRDRPPGRPRPRNATDAELALAAELEALNWAA